MDQRGSKPRKQLGRVKILGGSIAVLEELVQRAAASQMSIENKLLDSFMSWLSGRLRS